MQFAPFAALKGYYESIRLQERITEPRKELSEDEAEAISSTLNKLKVGTTVKIRYYDIDAYTNIEGVVTEINPPYRRLRVIKTAISFDDIYTIELLGKDAFRRELVTNGLIQSLSGTAHCYDNARMESFFATLKKEKLYQMPTYRMKRKEVKTIIFRYIFGYYNTQRINSFNEGGLPPVALRTSTGLAHHAA